MNEVAQDGALLFVTLVTSLLLTHIVVIVAERKGLVVKPKADRWHTRPTALYGGVAIFISCAGAAAFIAPRQIVEHRPDLLGLAVGALFLFGLGLLDDIRPLPPRIKLLGQLAAVVPFSFGLAKLYPVFWVVTGFPLLALFLVGLCNALNLLDNMNGLCAGMSAVIASLISGFAYLHDRSAVGIVSAALAVSCLGFLYHNGRFTRRARIFMGDCGSLFLGYSLSGLALLSVLGPGTNPAEVCTIPLLFLAIPIFDTMLVISRRLAEGRPVSLGGRDHSSHRLVYSGMSERRAVFTLYGAGLMIGGVALVLDSLNQMIALIALLPAAIVSLIWFGSYLSRYSMDVAVVNTQRTERVLDRRLG